MKLLLKFNLQNVVGGLALGGRAGLLERAGACHRDETNKAYYEDYKRTKRTRFQCECGGRCTLANRATHTKRAT